MFAFSIDILVYELALTNPKVGLDATLHGVVFAILRQRHFLTPMKAAGSRWSRCPAPVNRPIRAEACDGWAAFVVIPAVYMVASSHPGGSDPDRTTPLVEMISVDCVQPIGRRASDAASSRIAVAPFGKIFSRAATASAMPSLASTEAT